MKKIIFLILSIFCVTMVRAEPIKVSGAWGFGLGTNQAIYYRTILEQANKEQTKYQFSFDHRPGAGGSIAVKHAIDYKGPALVTNSVGHFIRPMLYPDTLYSLDQTRPILILGTAAGVLVTKGVSLKDLIAKPTITVGTSGPGTSTHLMAETLKRNLKGTQVIVVHHKDTTEAYNQVMGGHIDATFEWVGDARARAMPGITLVGVTGSIAIDGIPTLRDQGIREMEKLSATWAIFAPVTMSDRDYREIRDILLNAEKHESVQSLYRRDYMDRRLSSMTPAQMQSWYNDTIVTIRSLTAGIKL